MLLNNLLDNKKLPLIQGKINRRAIAYFLEIAPATTHQNRALRSLIAEFDSRLRTDNVPTSRFSKMELDIDTWLTSNTESGTLKTVAGKINRQWVCKHFAITSAALVRYPSLKQAILKHDRLIAGKIPFSTRYPDLLNKLASILDRAELPVHHGRLHLLAITKELGVPPGTLRTSPGCNKLISEAEMRLQSALPFNPICNRHKRRYNFACLVNFYGANFSRVLAARFVEVVAILAPGTAKTAYLALLDLLNWISKENPTSSLLASAKVGKPLEANEVRRLAWNWRTVVIAREGSETSRSMRIKSLERITRMLMPVFPSTGELAPIRYARQKARHKLSLAEVCNKEDIDRVADRVMSYTKHEGLDINRQEIIRFLMPLAVTEPSTSLSENVIERIRNLNSRRLRRMRECVETIFLREVAKLSEGKRLIASCDKTSQEIEALVNDALSGTTSKLQAQRFFTQDFKVGLSRYLVHVQTRFGGLVPRSSWKTFAEYKLFHMRITAALGGPPQVAAYLHLSTQGVSAACLLLLIDSGANGAVVRGLRHDCLRSSEIPGYRTIIGWKDRAGGKPISSDLPINQSGVAITAVRALEMTYEGTETLRKHASPENCELLFLIRSNLDNINAIPEHRLLKELRSFLHAESDFVSTDMTVEIIRPSVLLDAVLARDGNIRVAQSLAHHASSSTTKGYTTKYPTKLIYEAKIRKFQAAFQALAIAEIEEASLILGVDPQKIANLAQAAIATGLVLRHAEGAG